MKRKTRRLWSVLLALVMLVSLLGGTMLTAQAQEETITVYLDVESADWNQVYIYGWWDVIGYWPGMLMTHEGGSVYSAEIPADIQYVIFNNGNDDQTGNLELPGDGYIYTLAKEEWTVHNGCAHEWSAVSELWKEPTCAESGGQTCECHVCDGLLSYTIMPYGHDWVDGYCQSCGIQEDANVTVYVDMGIRECSKVLFSWWREIDDIGMDGEMLHVGGSVYSVTIPVNIDTLWFTDDDHWVNSDGGFADGCIYNYTEDEWETYNGCAHTWTLDKMSVPVSCTDR